MRRRPLLLVPPLGVVLALVLVALPTAQPPPSGSPAVHVAKDELTTSDQTVGPGWSRTVEGDTDLVGLQWQGDPSVKFTVEKRDRHGHWSKVSDVGVPDFGPDPGSPEARRHPQAIVSEPVWLGDAAAVRVRVANGTARAVGIHRVRVPKASASGNVAGALAPAPPIIARAQWGADESLRLANCPQGPQYDSKVSLAIVHHTDNDNNYSPADSARLVRGIYAYHTQALGYCDIAYNFLVDRYGQVFEGRYGGILEPVHGAHAIGFNTNTTGVATIGNFQAGAPPPEMVTALDQLLAFKLKFHGVDPSRPVWYVTSGNDKFPAGTGLAVPAIIGHRDTWFTDCPGQLLYDLLPQIRSDVIGRAASSWSGWGPLGGVVGSGTAVASWAVNRLDVFAGSSNGTLQHTCWMIVSWCSWENLGGTLVGDPAAASWAANRIDVFVRGTDNQLWHQWFDGAAWRGFEPLGGGLASGPAVASWAANRLDVFARAPDGQLQHKWWDGAAWSGWENLGGVLVGDPAAVSWGPNRIDVFVRGTDNQLYHKWWDGTLWSGWGPLGGVLTSSPAVASWAADRLDVFVRGTDNQLYHQWWDATDWRGYEALGGVLTSAPGAVSWAPNRIDVFVRGTDNQLWRKYWG